MWKRVEGVNSGCDQGVTSARLKEVVLSEVHEKLELVEDVEGSNDELNE